MVLYLLIFGQIQHSLIETHFALGVGFPFLVANSSIYNFHTWSPNKACGRRVARRKRPLGQLDSREVTNMAFSQEIRTKTLLWCDRHCCLCKKACGVNIEIHHIMPQSKGGSDEIDNAIPLCFDCHSDVERYNSEHPRGNKYKSDELRARREQVYEEFTRHLVPPLRYEITQIIPVDNGQHVRNFPDVGFVIRHAGDSLPVKVRVVVESLMNKQSRVLPSELYSGKKLWNLNPRHMFSGHFEMPSDLIPQEKHLELRVKVSVIDQYEREHPHLPLGFVYVPEGNYWYAEP